MKMLTQVGIVPGVSCSATTPADIQWMVRAGYGVALIDQRTPIDSALTTMHITGVVSEIYPGSTWIRKFVAAIGALMVSGMVRQANHGGAWPP
jgi:hypothetical protein